MVEIVVPGERWGVEFFSDGHTEIEVFGPSSGVIDETNLERLWAQFVGAVFGRRMNGPA